MTFVEQYASPSRDNQAAASVTLQGLVEQKFLSADPFKTAPTDLMQNAQRPLFQI